ncbi:MAG: DUF6445 family protein [Arenimonas sp.]
MLPYRKPQLNRDYWLLDNALPNALSVRERCLQKSDWELGHPHSPASWPGMRTAPALLPEEIQPIEAWVKKVTGSTKLWVESAPDGSAIDHNVVQVVGEEEGGVKPHTDSRAVCRYAAVLYLNPTVPAECGTSFYRERLGNGQLGGNIVLAPHMNLVDALGTRYVAPSAFIEDFKIEHAFNRLLLYRANLIHSASSYWGFDLEEKRMTAVFFWMAS